MTLPGMMPFGGLANAGLVALDLVDSSHAEAGHANYPADIRPGDLLLAWVNNDLDSASHNAGSGFTQIAVVTDSSGETRLAGRIADGTETGSPGGISDDATPIKEAILVYRGNVPIKAWNKVDQGGWHVPGGQPDVTVSSATLGDTPKMVAAFYSSTGTLSNPDIDYIGAVSDILLTLQTTRGGKFRSTFWGPSDTPTDVTVGMNTDPGTDNTVMAVVLEIE